MDRLAFLRRIGPDPHEGGAETTSGQGCPDIWELTNGDFAVIGVRATGSLRPLLPPSASCGADEEIVIVSRRIVLDAKSGIPDC
jgi:hypothetical protein